MDKREFEQLEGVFHHNLGSFAEVELANRLIDLSNLPQSHFSADGYRDAMDRVIEVLPLGDPRRVAWELEIPRIETAAETAARLLSTHGYAEDVRQVHHTPRDYAGGEAGDVRLEYRDNSAEPISVKTDKSGKVALAGGQTGLEQWAKRLYDLTADELENIAGRRLGMSLEDVRADYQDASHLVQWTVRECLSVDNVEINDWSRARPTDETAVRQLLRNVKRDLNGSDDAIVLVLERATGNVGVDAVIEALSPDDVVASEISFTPCRPKAGRYGTTLGFKYEGVKLFDHQVKHKRGKNPSHRFNDVTTRAARADGVPVLTDRQR